VPDNKLFSRSFAFVSIAEGFSFLLLLSVAMPLQFAAHAMTPVMIMGWVHGLLFIAYVLLTLIGRTRLAWSGRRSLWILAMAVLPTGAFFAERSVRAELSAVAQAARPLAA
jgi:integral membrane protein